MKAIGSYIVIEPIKEVNTKTKGGLLLAEKQREDIRYRKAKALKIGALVNSIKENDLVYYDRSAGTKIEIEGEEFVVVKESDIVVVL